MKLIFGLVALLLLPGCQHDPHAHRYTTEKPSVSDIVGKYELAHIYIESHAPGIGEKVKQLPSPPTIYIYSDGRFSASNFPYFSEIRQGFEYRFEDFRSLDTTWALAVVGSIDNGLGNIEDLQGIHLADQPGYPSSLRFTGTKKVDGLILGFGDPDIGDAIIFRKK